MCGANPCESPTCTWSESHRAACEALAQLTKPKEARAAYYALVLKHRGQQALDALRAEVNRQWALRSKQSDGLDSGSPSGLR